MGWSRVVKLSIILIIIFVFSIGCGRDDNIDRQGRKEIILATFQSNRLASELVNQFNRTNENYYITIDVYWDGICVDEGQMVRKKFDAAITNKRASRYPDIVVTEWNYDYFRYARRGVFEDLMPYLKADEEIRREDLFEQVLDTLLVDEKQYGLPTHFIIQALMLTEAAAATDRSLETITELQKVADYSILTFYERFFNLRFWILHYLDDIIDWQAGVCDFDNPLFISLLEMFKDIPEETDYFRVLDAIKDNEPIFLYNQITNIYKLQGVIDYLFGGDATIIGFPGREDEINVFSASIFSMTRNTRNKQIAWDFISSSVSDEFQMGKMDREDFYLTISRNVFDEYISRHSEEKVWPIAYTLYFGDNTRYKMSYLRQDTINTFHHLLDMKMFAMVFDDRLMDVILGEVYDYFDGQSLERTIINLNNRVGLYLEENR